MKFSKVNEETKKFGIGFKEINKKYCQTNMNIFIETVVFIAIFPSLLTYIVFKQIIVDVNMPWPGSRH